jgi:hypothetical protein
MAREAYGTACAGRARRYRRWCGPALNPGSVSEHVGPCCFPLSAVPKIRSALECRETHVISKTSCYCATRCFHMPRYPCCPQSACSNVPLSFKPEPDLPPDLDPLPDGWPEPLSPHTKILRVTAFLALMWPRS